jgi:hypothetical protein
VLLNSEYDFLVGTDMHKRRWLESSFAVMLWLGPAVPTAMLLYMVLRYGAAGVDGMMSPEMGALYFLAMAFLFSWILSSKSQTFFSRSVLVRHQLETDRYWSFLMTGMFYASVYFGEKYAVAVLAVIGAFLLWGLIRVFRDIRTVS